MRILGGAARAQSFAAKQKQLADGAALLRSLTLTPDQAGKHGLVINRDGRKRNAFELLSYPDVGLAHLAAIWPEIGKLDPAIAEQLSVDARYAVYVERQEQDIAAFRKDEALAIPLGFAYAALPGLSTELRQKLERHRPASLGQAARLDGMTPAALMPDPSGDAELLALAMRSLTSEQREVLVLCRFHELPFSEIGAILGCTAGAARVRAHRALVELREAYRKLAAPSALRSE